MSFTPETRPASAARLSLNVSSVKESLVDIQAIIDRDLKGSIPDGDYLSLVNVLKIVYDKNVRSLEETDEESDEETDEESDEESGRLVDLGTACLTIQNMWRKYRKQKQLSQDWIDMESEDIFGNMFEEDEKTWSLQYLEWAWNRMYRQHYGLGLFSTIPGDKITLSYWDFVSLSRGSDGSWDGTRGRWR